MIQEIRKYILETFHYKREYVESLELSKLLSLVEQGNIDKYNEFKLRLRNNGWII